MPRNFSKFKVIDRSASNSACTTPRWVDCDYTFQAIHNRNSSKGGKGGTPRHQQQQNVPSFDSRAKDFIPPPPRTPKRHTPKRHNYNADAVSFTPAPPPRSKPSHYNANAVELVPMASSSSFAPHETSFAERDHHKFVEHHHIVQNHLQNPHFDEILMTENDSAWNSQAYPGARFDAMYAQNAFLPPAPPREYGNFAHSMPGMRHVSRNMGFGKGKGMHMDNMMGKGVMKGGFYLEKGGKGNFKGGKKGFELAAPIKAKANASQKKEGDQQAQEPEKVMTPEEIEEHKHQKKREKRQRQAEKRKAKKLAAREEAAAEQAGKAVEKLKKNFPKKIFG
jgi:hypothetical protein